ncbi:efflux pump protein [Bisporella sp. PMI_857]|nr:efflux pump protein [Bisporella sp. PMI_857]
MSQTVTQPVEIEFSDLDTRLGDQAIVNDREALSQQVQPPSTPILSKRRSAAIITTIASVNFLNTLGSGLLTVALPRIARDLQLPHELLLWPAAIYGLTCGCTLLISGAVADVLGRRLILITGSFLYAAFTLGCGLCSTYEQLIAFRGFQGIAISLCLPSGIGVISNAFRPGQRRNIAFATLGGGSPLGYAVGLVLGGLFAESIGWRYGFHLGTICNFTFAVVAIWSLPADQEWGNSNLLERLKVEIDWVGAGIASSSLAMMFYVFAVLTASTSEIKYTPNIIILSIAIALLPAFVFWRNLAFTCICIAVFLTWASFNAFGYFASLFFQESQGLSPIQTSIRFLPTVVCGFLVNVITGLLVRSVSANVLVISSTLVTSVAYVLMAIIKVEWMYWYAAFVAIALSPVCSDVLYTTGMLIITSSFPKETQSLAGGVFNTISQIGNAVGLAAGGVVASSVTASKGGQNSKTGVLEGYHATFWTCFGAAVLVAVVSMVGLRKAGKVGLKVD